MRTPAPLVVVAFMGLAAGCSRGKPAASEHLQLVLDDAGRRPPVVSALELGREAKTTASAPARSGVSAPLHAHRKAHRRRPPAPLLARAPRAEHVPTIAAVPAPAPPVAVAPAPQAPAAADPAPTQAPDPQPASGRGGWTAPADGGGIHIPGFPGVIILRGGHSGGDACDEHGRGGMGGVGGGIFGIPGRIGRGSRGGGIVFLRGR